jgi:hypothetical protein
MSGSTACLRRTSIRWNLGNGKWTAGNEVLQAGRNSPIAFLAKLVHSRTAHQIR